MRTGEGGLAFLLDLPEVPSLAEGDALELEDGRLVRVHCADEALLEVDAPDPRTLARLARHLGNRHLPTEIGPGRLRIRADHVIEDMLRHLGATVQPAAGALPSGGRHLRPRADPRPRSRARPRTRPCARFLTRARSTGSWPGSRRPVRWGPTAIRTASSGPWRSATCATGTPPAPGSTTGSATAGGAATASSSPTPSAPTTRPRSWPSWARRSRRAPSAASRPRPGAARSWPRRRPPGSRRCPWTGAPIRSSWASPPPVTGFRSGSCSRPGCTSSPRTWCPRPSASSHGPLRVGIGGPVGSGKTALMEHLCRRLHDRIELCAIKNDIHTKEDALILTRANVLPEERILGVETGGCPRTAIREDASINLAPVADLRAKFPLLDVILIESGGDNLAPTVSPELADLTVYVVDVARGEKIPRKGGPGIFTNLKAGEGVDELVDRLSRIGGITLPA